MEKLIITGRIDPEIAHGMVLSREAMEQMGEDAQNLGMDVGRDSDGSGIIVQVRANLEGTKVIGHSPVPSTPPRSVPASKPPDSPVILNGKKFGTSEVQHEVLTLSQRAQTLKLRPDCRGLNRAARRRKAQREK